MRPSSQVWVATAALSGIEWLEPSLRCLLLAATLVGVLRGLLTAKPATQVKPAAIPATPAVTVSATCGRCGQALQSKGPEAP